MMYGSFTIGCDNEMPLRKGNRFISAIPLISGTKSRPNKLLSGGMVQHDGVAVEFGVPPTDNAEDWCNVIKTALIEVEDKLPKGVSFDMIASCHYAKKQLKHPEAQMIGCDTDYNAWTMRENIPPVEKFQKDTLRSFGAHVHVGYLENSFNNFLLDKDGKAQTIRVMDCIIGIPFTILDSSEAGKERRTLYGSPGCYRPTKYGVEYRVLSNFWSKHPYLVELVYSLVDASLTVMRTGRSMALIDEMQISRIVDTIADSNTDIAKVLIGIWRGYVPKAVQDLFGLCLSNKSMIETSDWKTLWGVEK